MTKADIIRGLFRKNPDAGPTAIIEIAKTKHKGVTISPQEVSTYKSQLRATGEADGKPRRKKRGRPKGKRRASPTESFIRLEGITKLKEAVEALGGKDNARRILEIL